MAERLKAKDRSRGAVPALRVLGHGRDRIQPRRGDGGMIGATLELSARSNTEAFFNNDGTITVGT
jgi:hypothetical protein